MPAMCPGCGGRYPEISGPTHSYMTSSPGCWKAYGDLLAREYSDTALFRSVHRLTVDAYALQHPGDLTDRRCSQSVSLHYTSLYLVFEKGWANEKATDAIKALASRKFEEITKDIPKFSVTLADVLREGEQRHEVAVRTWARHSFDVWKDLFPMAQRLVSEL